MPDLETLPILDLSLLDAGPESAAKFRDQLRAATHDLGFFYLIGTGVSPELEAEMFAAAEAFFDLPEEQKLEIENINSPHFRGYTRLGGERTLGQVDWREQIDISPEEEAVPASQLANHPDFVRLRGPNQWPSALPSLRPVVHKWEERLTEVSRKLLRSWAVSLGEDETYFDDNFGDPFTLLKIIKYPGTDRTQQGVGSHKDAGVLTLLKLQDASTGLQVLRKDGEWIDAPPVPGAFVVNIGEMLEYATQGYLRATTHRVIAPKTSSSRISIPFFFNPALDARLPLIRLPPELAAEANGVSTEAHNPIHALYGENALKSRLRAHPDVAQIHHSDILATWTVKA